MMLNSLLTTLTTQLQRAVPAFSATDGADCYAGSRAYEQIDDKQLIAVPMTSGHWLLTALCQEKRIVVEAELKEESCSGEELKTRLLESMLAGLNHKLLTTGSGIHRWSADVMRLASVFSELLPKYEPLLVEVALAHCLHEWSYTADDVKHNMETFEDFLVATLRGKAAANWFGCQLIIDTVNMLTLSRHFYEERITHKPLRDLMSMAVVRSRGDASDFWSGVCVDFDHPDNKTVADAWTAWLGKEIATVGCVQRSYKGVSSLMVLSDQMINPTQFHPDKRAYFPYRMEHRYICSDSFGDLSGVITMEPTTEDTDIMAPGFIYQGRELRATEAEASQGNEEDYEVVVEATDHQHTI